ncbi:MAG: YbaB/EbfC family nucleoid-associated protein [Candidatus Firestonebacteria bacterium]
MFDKMKQLYELQKKAKQMEKDLEQLSLTVDEAGGKLKLTVNGKFKITEIVVDPYYLAPDKKAELEGAIKRASSNAVGQMQKKSAAIAAEVYKSMGGLPNIPGM